MGKVDQLSRKYIRRQDVFADIVNTLEYQGERVIQPEMLDDEGSGLSELQIIPGKNQRAKETYVERFRDVLKTVRKEPDEQRKYAVFGVEEYTQVHYGAPVKLMLYDALNYSNQIETLANKHRIEHDKPADSGEFLSGIYREDRLIPVKTLIVYFSAKDWDGPRTLHDMLDMNGWSQEEKDKFPDYPISILEPSKLKEEQLETMQSDLGVVLGFIKYSTDREKLSDYVHEHKEFSAISNESARLLNEVCSLRLKNINEKNEEDEEKDANKEQGVFDMCKAFDDMKELGRTEGRTEGRIEGELSKVISQICRKLMKGKDLQTIADELEEEPGQIEGICRIAKKYAPDYDETKILEQVLRVNA